MSVMQARNWKEWLQGKGRRCHLVNTADNTQETSIVLIVGINFGPRAQCDPQHNSMETPVM